MYNHNKCANIQLFRCLWCILLLIGERLSSNTIHFHWIEPVLGRRKKYRISFKKIVLEKLTESLFNSFVHMPQSPGQQNSNQSRIFPLTTVYNIIR